MPPPTFAEQPRPRSELRLLIEQHFAWAPDARQETGVVGWRPSDQSGSRVEAEMVSPASAHAGGLQEVRGRADVRHTRLHRKVIRRFARAPTTWGRRRLSSPERHARARNSGLLCPAARSSRSRSRWPMEGWCAALGAGRQVVSVPVDNVGVCQPIRRITQPGCGARSSRARAITRAASTRRARCLFRRCRTRCRDPARSARSGDRA